MYRSLLTVLTGFLLVAGCANPANDPAPANPDQTAVDAATSTLAITYASGDSAASVTGNLTLPTSASGSVTVAWASDNATVVSAAGIVTQPASTAADVTVILTATLTRGSASATKKFTLTVKKQAGLSDTAAVAAAESDLIVGFATGDSATSVTQDVKLTTSGANGVAISWASNKAAVTSAGVVTQPAIGAADVTVTLTATISKNAVSATKTFTLVVKAKVLVPPTSYIHLSSITNGWCVAGFDLPALKVGDKLSLLVRYTVGTEATTGVQVNPSKDGNSHTLGAGSVTVSAPDTWTLCEYTIASGNTDYDKANSFQIGFWAFDGNGAGTPPASIDIAEVKIVGSSGTTAIFDASTAATFYSAWGYSATATVVKP